MEEKKEKPLQSHVLSLGNRFLLKRKDIHNFLRLERHFCVYA